MFNNININIRVDSVKVWRLFLQDGKPGDSLINPLRFSEKILLQKWNRNTITKIALEILVKLGAAFLFVLAIPFAAVGIFIKSVHIHNRKSRNVIIIPPTREQTQISLLFQKHILPKGGSQKNPFKGNVFETLPPEMLNEIFMYLNIRDFTSLKLTTQASANIQIHRFMARNIEANSRLWKI